jgi:phosphonate transport system substrate-binding protein
MKVSTLLMACAALAVAQPAYAEFALDDRFTDADGDLIADIPTDPSEWSIPTR